MYFWRLHEVLRADVRAEVRLSFFSYRCAARGGIGLWLYVDSTDQQVMFAEKSWESYRVLDVSDKSLMVKVTLNPGHGMNYHSHERWDEVWMVVSGSGRVGIDGVN